MRVSVGVVFAVFLDVVVVFLAAGSCADFNALLLSRSFLMLEAAVNSRDICRDNRFEHIEINNIKLIIIFTRREPPCITFQILWMYIRAAQYATVNSY